LLINTQVNGVDVSGSQERALEELSRAQEPILVHIKRKEQEQEALNDNDDQAEDVIDEEEEEEDDEDEYDDDQIVIPDLEYQVKRDTFLVVSVNCSPSPPPPTRSGDTFLFFHSFCV
jgi:hypothetical protein